MRECDFCYENKGSIKFYAYKARAKRPLRVCLCNVCASKEKANIICQLVKE